MPFRVYPRFICRAVEVWYQGYFSISWFYGYRQPGNINLKGEYEKEYAWFSWSAYLPVVAANPDRTAARIVAAMQGGERIVSPSLSVKAARVARALFPGLTVWALGLVNRLLPPYMDRGHEPVSARELEKGRPKSRRVKKAEEKYNQGKL